MHVAYLAGAINGCTDEECKDWREHFTGIWPGETLDPMRRDYRGLEDDSVVEIILGDVDDIRRCNVVVVNADKPSWGTAMEIIIASWLLGKPVALRCPADMRISPWLRGFVHAITHTHEECAQAAQYLARYWMPTTGVAADVRVALAKQLAPPTRLAVLDNVREEIRDEVAYAFSLADDPAAGNALLAEVLRSRGHHNTLHDLLRASDALLEPCPKCAAPPGKPCSRAEGYAEESHPARVKRMEEALREIARLRTDLRGDFSLGSHQSDIARRALSAVPGGTMSPNPTPSP